jgi:PhnB protein
MEQNASFRSALCESRRRELAVPDANHSAEADDGIRPVPEGYRAVTPWIVSRDTARLLDFVKEAFGAEEIARVLNEDGTIGHAEFRIGDSIVMAFDAREGWPDTPGFFRLYVEDGGAVYRRTLGAGAVSVTEMTHLFFGDRVGRVRDPQGNVWWIQSRVEEVDAEEMERRAGEKGYVDAMQYVQESLDRELGSRSRR